MLAMERNKFKVLQILILKLMDSLKQSVLKYVDKLLVLLYIYFYLYFILYYYYFTSRFSKKKEESNIFKSSKHTSSFWYAVDGQKSKLDNIYIYIYIIVE